jgi:hypothetical protein
MFSQVTGIALGKNQDGRLDLVATAILGEHSAGGRVSIWHRWQVRDGGDWSAGWHSLPMPITWAYGQPAVALNKEGCLEVAVTCHEGVRHCWQTAPNGEEWRGGSLGKPGGVESIQTPPTLAQNRDGRLEVFIAAEDRMVWHCWQHPSGGWSTWESLGAPSGQLNRLIAPVVIRNKDGRLEVFIAAEDRMVWHCWQHPSGGWSTWESLEGPGAGAAS